MFLGCLMFNLTQVVHTFPSVHIPSCSGGLSVEVSLIAQLGHGAGNHLFSDVSLRQKHHHEFSDELDEPSAKIGGTDYNKDDYTALYTFVVGPNGHPFHRHAGHRIFTAVSGSGGAQLRFSSASQQQILDDPHNFIKALHFVNIPPDCLFTVRFGGETWHQFYPLSKNSLHPVLFALSCHTNELGGDLSDDLKKQVIANAATIPSLTELLPQNVLDLLQSDDFQEQMVLTTTLSLDAPAGTLHRKVCDTFRGSMGLVRGAWGKWFHMPGFKSQAAIVRDVEALRTLPENSILRTQMQGKSIDHIDMFRVVVRGKNLRGIGASALLAYILEGFLRDAPKNVSRLMAFRNVMVAPFGLRTSPLACPVSSLLSDRAGPLFAGQYPVIDQAVDANDTVAQIVLGADDKHLQFRSSVGVKMIDDITAEISLGNIIHYKNNFGKFYMAMIDLVHRHYIAPTMLRRAIDYAIMKII